MECNLIKNEINKSKEFDFEKYDDELIKLSFENVAKVELMIKYNSSYNLFSNYETNSIIKLKNEVELMNDEDKEQPIEKNDKLKFLLKNAINDIDNVNSTHINSDDVGRKQILDRLSKYTIADMYNKLKNPISKEGNYSVITDISYPTKPKDDKHHSRINFSFATKFCHDMCYYLFEGEKEQDNFPNYDSVLCKTLPRYFDHFRKYYENSSKNNLLKNYFCFNNDNPCEIIKYNLDELKENGKHRSNEEIANILVNKYSTYCTLIANIMEASKEEIEESISRNGFDHLLWYCYKGKD